ANSQLNRAVRAPPTCRYPVGDGAKRTRGFSGELIQVDPSSFWRLFILSDSAIEIEQGLRKQMKQQELVPAYCPPFSPARSYSWFDAALAARAIFARILSSARDSSDVYLHET